eukprot:scaffold4777_cov258-Pinguiococcus_pyrenoidosus.AAC.4
MGMVARPRRCPRAPYGADFFPGPARVETKPAESSLSNARYCRTSPRSRRLGRKDTQRDVSGTRDGPSCEAAATSAPDPQAPARWCMRTKDPLALRRP